LAENVRIPANSSKISSQGLDEPDSSNNLKQKQSFAIKESQMKNYTSVFFQRVSNRVDHIDVMDLDNQLPDIEHRRFEIEKHEQENI